MTLKTDTRNDTEAEAESLDRRGDNRAASAWVRTALTEQTDRIEKLTGKVEDLHKTFVKAIPGGNIDAHNESHIVLEQREIFRVKRDKEREEAEAARRKFWRGVKEDALKNALKAVAIFFIGVLVLGSQAKFKEWVSVAVATEVKK